MHQSHHAIDYVEFTAPDLEAIKAFYSSAFGWTFTDYGPEYVGFVGGPQTGLDGGFAQGALRPGGPLVILFSTDLAASERAVVARGGKITTPSFEFPGGRRFHFADPAGNVLAVWSEK